MQTDELLGVTTCPTCQKRFRVSKKYESFIGKPISCPKCKRPFAIKLETPAPIEQAALATTSDAGPDAEPKVATDESAKPKKKKRTKAQIRKAAYKRIRKGFGPCLKQLQAISTCDSYSEEKIRVWCVDVLRTALGYKNDDLDFELSAVDDFIDIAVKHDGNVILIIECKKHTTLPKKARDQALKYATLRSANWAAVTNGRDWELHRVIPVDGQNPRMVEVFNVSVIDDDGLSDYDVERMYLLTKRALLNGETEREFHLAQCLDKTRMLEAIFSDRAIKAMRRSLVVAYKGEFKQNVKLTSDEVHEALKDLVRPDEL